LQRKRPRPGMALPKALSFAAFQRWRDTTWQGGRALSTVAAIVSEIAEPRVRCEWLVWLPCDANSDAEKIFRHRRNVWNLEDSLFVRSFSGRLSAQSRFGRATAGREHPMCDYSLHAVESRPAQVADKLISTSFRNSSTRGFAALDNRHVAVCLLPGTELAFDEDVKFYHRWIWTKSTGFRVARFCSVDEQAPDRHHDALEFPDGRKVLVTLLVGGQRATVLQLPVRRETADRLRAAEHHQELASPRTVTRSSLG
jgi:hypothetical protein